MLLDTDVLIDLIRGHTDARAWFVGLPTFPSVPCFCAQELLFGALDTAELKKIERFLKPFSVVYPTEADLQRVTSWPKLKLSHGLGLTDALIGSVAIGQGQPLVTFNRKHFGAIPGLTTVQPYKH